MQQVGKLTGLSNGKLNATKSNTVDCSSAEKEIGAKKEDPKENISSISHVNHEVQTSQVGEADLLLHFERCMGRSNHSGFIPVPILTINHLPENYQDTDILHFIKATSDLTVRVAVKRPSKEGSDVSQNDKTPPVHDTWGSDVLRTGSGIVISVCNYNEKDKMGNCECEKCQLSGTPKKVLGAVWICSARHVVSNDDEVKQTTCRFFYDEQNSPLVSLDCWSVTWENTEDDRINLKCLTCNEELLRKLTQMVNSWYNLWEKVNKKYEPSRASDKINFIVSHPHGCSKQISVGHWIDRHVIRQNDIRSHTKFTYNTCTCPGSSGAFVYFLGYHDIGWLSTRHVHSGVCPDGTKCSSSAEEWRREA